MQFFYSSLCGEEIIKLDSKDCHYLFRVRRFKEGGRLEFRNLLDNKSYFYTHFKKDIFKLSHIVENDIKKTSNISIFLALIDIKDIYDLLPFLNELNINSLNLFYGDYSQKNRALDLNKANTILRYSSMQCGRFDVLKINILKNLDEVLSNYKNVLALDFNAKLKLPDLVFNKALDGVIIGPEGGFSPREKELIKNKSFSINIPNILQAHHALNYIASILSL